MSRTKAYRQYCLEHKDQVPLFHRPWWLDIVCGSEQWVGIVSEGSFLGIKAIMPIPILKKHGISIVQKPPLTTFLGPWWSGLEELSPFQKDKLAMRLWPDLLAQIPRTVYFHQTFRPEISLGLPFHTNGYRLGTRYTFRLDGINDQDEIYRNFKKNTRKDIVKNQGEVSFQESDDIQLLYQLVEHIYNRQHIKTPIRQALLQALYQAGKKEESSKMLIAYNEEQQPIGGMIYFWDHHTIYLTAIGVTNEGRAMGVFPKLVWETIKQAPAHCKQCDFCGSMMASIAKKNSTFHAIAHSFLEVKKWTFNLL